MKNLVSRLKNVGTIITLVSLVTLLFTLTGVVEVDNDKVMQITYVVCSIGVVLGVLNNPETSGIDLPGVDYPVFKQPELSPENILDSVSKLNNKNSSDEVKDALTKK